MWWIVLLVLGAAGGGLWWWRRRRRASRRIDSLVLLLAKSVQLMEWQVRDAVNAALGMSLTGEEEEGQFVTGAHGQFILQLERGVYMLFNFPRPYVDDREGVADGIGDLRLAEKLRRHQAWLSVDLMHSHEETTPLSEHRRVIGKVLSEILPHVEEHCLAIYDPAEGHIAPYTEAMRQTLGGEDPMSVFVADRPPPVIHIGADDPRMIAAVAEARRRWPEFVDALARREADQMFAAKFPFRNGNPDSEPEFLWVLVDRVEGNQVHGQIDNDPLDLPLKAGDEVSVSVSDLNDWMYGGSEQQIGGFTVQVLRDRGH